MKYTATELKKMNTETLEKCVQVLNIQFDENFDFMFNPINPQLLHLKVLEVRNELQAQLNINKR